MIWYAIAAGAAVSSYIAYARWAAARREQLANQRLRIIAEAEAKKLQLDRSRNYARGDASAALPISHPHSGHTFERTPSST